MRERWTSPPIVASEPPPPWRARWRYRLVAALLALLVLTGAVLAYRSLTGPGEQNPEVGLLRPVTTPAAPAG